MVSLFALVGVCVVFYVPIWQSDAETRAARKKVIELVKVGDNLYEAQERIKDAGFELYFEEPTTPTIDEDYLHQMVKLNRRSPNAAETFGYMVGLSWVPFSHSESSVLIIEAELGGTIRNLR